MPDAGAGGRWLAPLPGSRCRRRRRWPVAGGCHRSLPGSRCPRRCRRRWPVPEPVAGASDRCPSVCVRRNNCALVRYTVAGGGRRWLRGWPAPVPVAGQCPFAVRSACAGGLWPVSVCLSLSACPICLSINQSTVQSTIYLPIYLSVYLSNLI